MAHPQRDQHHDHQGDHAGQRIDDQQNHQRHPSCEQTGGGGDRELRDPLAQEIDQKRSLGNRGGAALGVERSRRSNSRCTTLACTRIEIFDVSRVPKTP